MTELQRAQGLLRQGLVTEALEVFRQLSRSSDPERRRWGELGAGLALQVLGRFEEAGPHLQAAASLGASRNALLPLVASRWLGSDFDSDAALRSLLHSPDAELAHGAAAMLGILLFETGRANEGKQVLEMALKAARNRSPADPSALAHLLVVLGSRLGEAEGASLLREATALEAAPVLTAAAWTELAALYGRERQWELAAAAAAQACTLAAQWGDRGAVMRADAEVLLAAVNEEAGRWDDAEAAWRRALSALRVPGQRDALGKAMLSHSSFLARRNRPLEAMDALRAAAAQLGPGAWGAQALRRLAHLYLALTPPRVSEAGAALHLGLAYLEADVGGDTLELALLLEQLVAHSALVGRFDDAKRYACRAIELRERAPGPLSVWAARPLAQLAACHLLTGDVAAAEPLLERARVLLSQGPVDAETVLTVLLNFAALLDAQGAHADAAKLRSAAEQVTQASRSQLRKHRGSAAPSSSGR